MRLIPVIDVRGGAAVHAVAGDRAAYRPLRSVLTTSTVPAQVAADVHRQVGNAEVYVADLDAIEAVARGARAVLSPAVATLVEWAHAVGVVPLIDAGVSSAEAARALFAAPGPVRPVVGTETLAGLDALGEILATARDPQSGPRGGGPRSGEPSVVASLDLRAGELLTPAPELRGRRVEEAAALLAGAGIAEMIVLDLARVGTGTGAAVEHLGPLRAACPHAAFLIGGGVRTGEEIAVVAAAGAAGALIATALHSGAIGPPEWRRLAERA
jgi:phosphoribosylformimino-5-aminoimidazole carboxamide ribotide isomerase